MESSLSEHRPSLIVGRRVKEARTQRGWTQQRLSDELGKLGYPLSRVTVVKLERDPSRLVAVDELFALAAALGIAPVHLVTPFEEDEDVAITPRVRVPAPLARAWVRGEIFLPMLPDVDLRSIPRAELRRRLIQGRTRGMDQLFIALVREKVEAEADLIIAALHNELEQEEES